MFYTVQKFIRTTTKFISSCSKRVGMCGASMYLYVHFLYKSQKDKNVLHKRTMYN